MIGRKALLGGDDAVTPVSYTDHGNHTPDTESSTTHAYNSKTTTGASRAYVLLTWRNNTSSVRTVSSATWNGGSMTIEAQVAVADGSELFGAAILSASGAQTGNISIAFSGFISESQCQIVSTDDESSGTIDTDTANSNSTSDALTALTDPASTGLRLAVAAFEIDNTALSWTNATELGDVDAGVHRHGSAADQTFGGDISVSGGSGAIRLVGISIE